MLTLSILCLWLSSPSSGSAMVPLTQLQPQYLFSVANSGQQSLILYGEMREKLVIRLYLYDFQKKQGRHLDEKQSAEFVGGHMVAGTKGWYLWHGTDNESIGFTLFSHQGQRLEKIAASTIKGWVKNYSVRSMYRYGQNKALLTLTKPAEPGENYPKPFPAVLDFASMTLTPMNTEPPSEVGTEWVPFGKNEAWLQINLLCGGMVLTTKTNHAKTLRPNSEPLESPRQRNIEKTRSPFFKYEKHYQNIVQQEDSISCEQVVYDEKGQFEKTVAMVIDPQGRIQEQDKGVLISQYQGRRLVFEPAFARLTLVTATQ